MNAATYAKRFPFGCWSYLGPGCEKKRYGTHVNKPNGERTGLPRTRLLISLKSGILFFQTTSPVERGEFFKKSKGSEKKSIHFNRSDETVELILRTVISVNQLSIYGAVANLCEELARDSPSARKTSRK